jgi:hypothetical protein
LKKTKKITKKGKLNRMGLKAQARALGPVIFFQVICIFFKKERISRQHVTWCGRRRVACQLRIQPLLWWLKKSGLRVFFYQKTHFFHQNTYFSTISTTKHP